MAFARTLFRREELSIRFSMLVWCEFCTRLPHFCFLSITLKVGEEERKLDNDAVFALIGGDPPRTWLQKIGVNIVTVKETVGSQW